MQGLCRHFNTSYLGDHLMLLQDHGAVGDGETYDTAAIQAAIEDCAAHPEGGVVTFEENTRYLSAQIIVRNGVRLRIPKTTTLLAGLKVALPPYHMQTCSVCMYVAQQNHLLMPQGILASVLIL